MRHLQYAFIFLQETVIRLYDNTEHFESTGVDHLLLAAKLTIFRHMHHVVQEVVTNVPCEGNSVDLYSSKHFELVHNLDLIHCFPISDHVLFPRV